MSDPAGTAYVPPAERIAVFDNDGTLWTEKPIVPQGMFIFQRIVELAPEHPAWQTTQPYAAVLTNDAAALQSLGPADVEKLLFAASAGMTEAEFEAEVEIYGIARDDVVGSSLAYEFQQTADGSVLVRKPEIDDVDLNELKPVNIQRHIGRRPILAAGNSDGDIEMLQYTGGDGGPFLILVIVHDDAEREYDYLTGADKLMSTAAQSPWTFVSMAQDFKTVFPDAAGPGR